MKNDQGISETAWRKSFSSDRLRLLVLPTEKCNLRCTYCYEDFSMGRMSAEIRSGLIKFLRKRKEDLRYLDIDWFGGEPLLFTNDILSVMEQVGEIFDAPSRTTIRSSITTNAVYLSLQTAERLIEASVDRFQVTLDGDRATHDQRRRQKSGLGTYDTIHGNVAALLGSDLPFTLTLRVHFDKNTINSVLSFVESKVVEFAKDPRVSVVFAELENLSPTQQLLVPELAKEDRQAAVDRLYTLVPTAHSKSTEQYVCYAAQPNAFVVRSSGQISKCTVALNDDLNAVGHLTENGDIIINERHAAWLAGWAEDNPTSLACPYAAILGVDEAFSRTI